MNIEEVKEPCEECVHRDRCSIRNPELKDSSTHPIRCEKLDKHSAYISTTRIIY